MAAELRKRFKSKQSESCDIPVELPIEGSAHNERCTGKANYLDSKDQDGNSKSTFSKIENDLGKYSTLAIHFSAVLLFALGFFFRTSLHNGSECEMTYSMRQFLEIETSFDVTASRATENYKLYRFVDRRDPRIQNILDQKRPLTSNYCEGSHTQDYKGDATPKHSSRIVLYIPGHWGSFTQSRSVGAHGIQLTGRGNQGTRKVQEALSNRHWTGKAADERDFIFDVYSVDFCEQGGGLHGRLLELQSDFVASAIELLISNCDVQYITLFGHSMGGYVARLALVRHPHLQQHVRSILTLATPHLNPLYAFEKKVHDVHKLIKENSSKDTLVVSISGGIRDEMIKSSACFIDDQTVSLSILSTRLVSNGILGMDHRAIVWCHEVLDKARSVIFNLGLSESKPMVERLVNLQSLVGNSTFLEDVDDMENIFLSRQPTLITLCMESAMLYNLPCLLAFFVFITSVKFSFYDNISPKVSVIVIIFSIVAGWVFTDLSKACAAVLALVANTIDVLLTSLIPLDFLSSKEPFLLILLVFIGSFLAMNVFAFICLEIIRKSSFIDHYDTVLFISGVLGLYVSLFLLAGFGKQHSKNSRLIVLTFVCIPVWASGPIALLSWEEETRMESWFSLLYLFIPLLASTVVQAWNRAHDKRQEIMLTTRSFFILIAVCWTSPILFTRGKGYILNQFVPFLVCADTMIDFLLCFL